MQWVIWNQLHYLLSFWCSWTSLILLSCVCFFAFIYWFVLICDQPEIFCVKNRCDNKIKKRAGDCNHTCTLEVTDYCCALTTGLNFALVKLTESKNGAKVVSELSGYCREESLQLEDKNVYITSKFTIIKTEILKKQKNKLKILKVFCKKFCFKWIILYFKCE